MFLNHEVISMSKGLKKILIVDDDDSIRKTFALVLGKKYRILAEKDPAQALDKAQTARVDLVITDVKMPGFNGLELIKKLREGGYQGDAMLISAHPEMVRLEDLGRYQISHYFVKPLDLKVLDLSIERLFQMKEAPGAGA
jgi:YesN/AraC family two-component response regulator